MESIWFRWPTDGKTVMGRAHTIMRQYGMTMTKAIFSNIFRLNRKTFIYNRYPHGQNGLIDSLRAIFNDYTHCNQGYAQMLLRF